MRKLVAVPLLSLLSVVFVACTAAEPHPQTAAAVLPDRDPQVCAWPEGVTPAPAPACPSGCVRDGDVCRRQRGIIVHEAQSPTTPQSSTITTASTASSELTLWQAFLALFTSEPAKDPKVASTSSP